MRPSASRFGIAALLALPLAACQTMTPPVEVTRFHRPEPPAGGAIAVAPMAGVDAGMEYRTYATAVEQALARSGFAPAGGVSAGDGLVAEVAVRSDVRAGGPRPRPVSGWVGGSAGNFGSGLGGGISVNLSGPPKDVILTELSVRILRRGDGVALWEGRAVLQTRAGTPAAQPGIAAAKLADALFQGYPGRSGETITVR